jgi:hypothetical protein
LSQVERNTRIWPSTCWALEARLRAYDPLVLEAVDEAREALAIRKAVVTDALGDRLPATRAERTVGGGLASRDGRGFDDDGG